MPPIRIALITTELGVGGAEKCLTAIAARLDRREFSPQVYCLAPPPDPQRAALLRLLQEANVPTHFACASRSWQLPAVVRKLRGMLRAQAPQVVQTFLFHGNVAGALASAGLPEAALVCGARVAEPRPWRLRWERMATRRAAKLVCVSQSVADFYHQRAGFARHRLEVIANGVDRTALAAVPPAPLDAFLPPAEEPPIVAVGRLDRQKGFDWLLEAMAELFARRPEQRLLIVGDGPEKRRLMDMAASQATLRDRVAFALWQENVLGILKSAKMLVMSSRYEGMPNVLLEAMAVGLPVVATQAEGVLEVLGPLAEAQSAPAGDRAAFLQAVERILSDASLAGQLGAANQARIASQFDLDAMVRRYEALYRSLQKTGG